MHSLTISFIISVLISLQKVRTFEQNLEFNTGINASRWLIEGLGRAWQGFDPMISDIFVSENPGFKDVIFSTLQEQQNGRNVLNLFVTKSEKNVYCNEILNINVIRNFHSYKKQRHSDLSFSENSDEYKSNELTSSINDTKSFNIENQSAYERNDTNHEAKIKFFFLKSQGEIIEINTECTTYSVALSSNIKPVFTNAFTEALKRLHTAAKDPDSGVSNETFSNFVREFGTHYMKKMKLGSKIIFQKLFVSKSRDQEEFKRRQECVKNSVRMSILKNSVFSCSETFQQESQKCDESNDPQKLIELESVIPIGNFHTNFESWLTMAMNNPVPISFELDIISHITRPDWINDIRVSDNEIELGHLNGSLITNFLENKYSSYCELLLGMDCLSPQTGCDSDGECPVSTYCVTDGTAVENNRCKRGEWNFLIVRHTRIV